MNITVTNLGTVAVPFFSTQDKGFVVPIEPNQSHTLNSTAVTVTSVGDNPTFREEVEEALETLVEAIASFVMFWKRKQPDEDPVIVRVMIQNHGTNGLRVLLGSNVNEVQVEPGVTYEANAPEFVEIRELGV
ncbi:MAG TPA: hypothetical protein VN680_00195 [Burkholderiaceae bacterium]|nr:hypothetical protein [Burkholderiaceae bacterium]